MCEKIMGEKIVFLETKSELFTITCLPATGKEGSYIYIGFGLSRAMEIFAQLETPGEVKLLNEKVQGERKTCKWKNRGGEGGEEFLERGRKGEGMKKLGEIKKSWK